MAAISSNYFDPLSEEIIIKIFSSLDLVSLSNVSLVCKQFLRISDDDSLWTQELSQRKINVIQRRAKSQLVEHLRNYCSFFINCIKTSEPPNEKNVFSYCLKIKSIRKSSAIDLKSIFSNLAKINCEIGSDLKKMDSLMFESFLREERLRLVCRFSDVEESITHSLSDKIVSLLISQVEEAPCEHSLKHPLKFKRSDHILKQWIDKSKVNMTDLELALKDGRSEEVVAYLSEKVSQKGDLISNNVVRNAYEGKYSDKFVEKLTRNAGIIDGVSLKFALENGRSAEIIEMIISKLNLRDFQSDQALVREIISIAQIKGYPTTIINRLSTFEEGPPN